MKNIIICYLLNYFIVIFFCVIYTIFGGSDINAFLQGPVVYLVLIFEILVTIYLYFKYRKKEKKISINRLFLYISFGISLAIFLNMIIFIIFPNTSQNTIPTYLLFLSSGIIGPIYEEILFRYVFFNQLINKYSRKKAITICTFVFAIIHLSTISIIYAFFIGIFLTFFYNKEQSIIVPIFIHISANSIVFLLNEFSFVVFLLSIVSLSISMYGILKKD